jgi:pyruvate formate lyase activating enzyme
MKQCKKNKKLGKIHSFESFGTQEGPGIRYVVFLQGCIARCLYCQNPDTWDLNAGKSMSAAEVFSRIEKCLPYINSSGGGMTISGGEPLIQPDFLLELLKICRKNAVHTAIDTAGFYNTDKNRLNKIIGLTDLFIVDIKAPDQALHKKLTSMDLKESLSFIGKLEKKKKSYWIRYVIVPTINNSRGDLIKLKAILSGLKYCKKTEFLPYHILGQHKWAALGIKYPLKGIPVATAADINKANKVLNS